jgi:hypothetical protein
MITPLKVGALTCVMVGGEDHEVEWPPIRTTNQTGFGHMPIAELLQPGHVQAYEASPKLGRVQLFAKAVQRAPRRRVRQHAIKQIGVGQLGRVRAEGNR